MNPYELEEIGNWAADFADAPAFGALPSAEKEYGVSIASEFLRAACEAEGASPGTVGEAGARAALLEVLPRLDLPASIRPRVPEIVALFCEGLAAQGRLAGGGSLASFVRALGPSYRERLRPEGGMKSPPLRNAAPPLGRNDPCPCGSGTKYKKCCGK